MTEYLSIVFGSDETDSGPYLIAAGGLFALTFVAYGFGAFGPDAPLTPVLVPVVFVAGIAGYRRSGLAIALLLAAGAPLGYHASDAFVGASALPLSERARYFLDPAVLLTFVAESAFVGTVGFCLGYLLSRAFDSSTGASDGIES